MNSNDYVINRGGSTASGGTIRDDCGRVIEAYSINLCSCSITRTEICEVVDGMTIAWELGIRRLAIQVDSRCVIDILIDTSNSSHQHSSLVTLFQRLREREWEVRLYHVYREANYLVDALANHGHGLAPGTRRIDINSDFVQYWEGYDARGVLIRRAVTT
ncbi:Putative ribonuclease H protein At1g65750 [Linum perenne]